MDSSAGSHGIARTVRTRTEEQKKKDVERIQKYQALEAELRAKVKQEDYTSLDLLHLTTKLLRLNPEYYTIWNVRRRCLISGSLSKRSDGSWPLKASPNTSASATTKPSSVDSSLSSSDATQPGLESPTPQKAGQIGTTPDSNSAVQKDMAAEGAESVGASIPVEESDPGQNESAITNDTSVIQSELDFTIPLLLEFPKCYWIWNYRAFLLQLSISRLPTRTAREVWSAELALTSKMLTKDQRNFHAWSYRRSIVQRLESSELGGDSMAQTEFDYTTEKINRDLSNFSAWHHRSQVVLQALDDRHANGEERKRFLEAELSLARDALNVGPEDQSLWYYHQFLISQLTDHVARPTIAPALTVEERTVLVEREIEEIRDLAEDYADIKWIFEALIGYSVALQHLQRESVNVGDGELVTTSDELSDWLKKLRKLDPMRNGRWDDLEKAIL